MENFIFCAVLPLMHSLFRVATITPWWSVIPTFETLERLEKNFLSVNIRSINLEVSSNDIRTTWEVCLSDTLIVHFEHNWQPY